MGEKSGSTKKWFVCPVLYYDFSDHKTRVLHQPTLVSTSKNYHNHRAYQKFLYGWLNNDINLWGKDLQSWLKHNFARTEFLRQMIRIIQFPIWTNWVQENKLANKQNKPFERILSVYFLNCGAYTRSIDNGRKPTAENKDHIRQIRSFTMRRQQRSGNQKFGGWLKIYPPDGSETDAQKLPPKRAPVATPHRERTKTTRSNSHPQARIAKRITDTLQTRTTSNVSPRTTVGPNKKDPFFNPSTRSPYHKQQNAK